MRESISTSTGRAPCIPPGSGGRLIDSIGHEIYVLTAQIRCALKSILTDPLGNLVAVL